jgi:hypothetical protein
MDRLILGQHSLSDQHVKQAAQPPLQGDFARVAIFMRLRASQFGQQLHLGPVPGFCQARRESQPRPSPRRPGCAGPANPTPGPLKSPDTFSKT